MKTKLSTKYVRPTNCTFGHTKIFLDETYIGYIIQDRSQFRTIDKNWHFCPNSIGIELAQKNSIIAHSIESNRTKTIQSIKEKFNAE